MENIVGYARLLAGVRVEQQINKPFLGKPYLLFGQLYILNAYFFQLGGILGAKHSGELDAFGLAFLGAHGEPGAVKRFFVDVSEKIIAHSENRIMTFPEYVCADMIDRLGYKGEANDFVHNYGSTRIDPAVASKYAWQYAESGAATGAIQPQTLRRMFDKTHTPVPEATWGQALAAGVAVPPVEEASSYEEVELDEDALFMAYCQECCPDLYSVLTGLR